MEKKEKGFLHQILIEIIAIFIGITLALLIDNFKDNQRSTDEIKNHFNLILTEFSKDSLELHEIDSMIDIQINKINLLCSYLKSNNSKSFNEHLDQFGDIRIYNPRIDEINFILNSSSYSQIYNDSIFSELNNLKSDLKSLEFIQNYEYQLIRELKNDFIFPHLDIDSQLIDVTKINSKNHFFNKLKEYQNLLSFKKAIIEGILSGSLKSIDHIQEVIN